ncbi:hypothetical protein [Pandoraea pneumonica]
MVLADERQIGRQYAHPTAPRSRSMGQIYAHIEANLKHARQCAIDAAGGATFSHMAGEIDDFQACVDRFVGQARRRSDFSLGRGIRGNGFKRSVRGQWDVANPSNLTPSAHRLHKCLLEIDGRSGEILSRAKTHRVNVAMSTAARIFERDNEIFAQAYAMLANDLAMITSQVARIPGGTTASTSGMATVTPSEAPPPYSPDDMQTDDAPACAAPPYCQPSAPPNTPRL